MKKKVTLVVISLMLVFMIVISISYALWRIDVVQETPNVVNLGCLDLTMENEMNEINLSNASPISEKEGKMLTPFTFTLKNTCNTDAEYWLNLEILENSTVPSKYINYLLNDASKSRNLFLQPEFDEKGDNSLESRNLEHNYLKAGESKEFSLRLWIDINLTNEYSNRVIKIKTVILNKASIYKDNVEVPEILTPTSKNYKCKRATTLHTEECPSSNQYCKIDGYTLDGSKGTTTVTYGNLGTRGELNPGDAFDCDVNGDGVYDEETERFYYVSGYNPVVLMYSNNVLEDEIKNTFYGVPYYKAYSGSTTVFTYGPDAAIEYLPSGNNWSNVYLISNYYNRTIYDEKGNAKIKNFSYRTSSGSTTSRLLSIRDLPESCRRIAVEGSSVYNGECLFLSENTTYANEYGYQTGAARGYWLEEVDSSNSAFSRVYNGESRSILKYYAGESSGTNSLIKYGVRPAIEVYAYSIEI